MTTEHTCVALDVLAAMTARLRDVAERCEVIATASRAQGDMLTAQAYEDAAEWITQALETAP